MTRPATTRSPARRSGAAAWLQAAMRSAPLAATLAIGAMHGPSRSGALELPAITVHVVSHGWHSGIIVPAALAHAHDWPVRNAFPRAEYYEVGWGDRAYYRATDPGWWLGLRAAVAEPEGAAGRGNRGAAAGRSVERFHLFATCNVRVARRLREGGLELHPSLALTAGTLFGQLARHVPAPAASIAPAAN